MQCIPQEIKNALEGLSNDLRLRILESLIEKYEMSYSEIMRGLHINNKGILTFHLGVLSENALITREEILGKKSGNKYRISIFGTSLINGLLSGLVPR
jgi:DNA-binding HxlR family transcriptional regulator